MKESQLNGKLNHTALRFRLCYINIQVVVIAKSKNLDRDQSVVLARCVPLCHDMLHLNVHGCTLHSTTVMRYT